MPQSRKSAASRRDLNCNLHILDRSAVIEGKAGTQRNHERLFHHGIHIRSCLRDSYAGLQTCDQQQSSVVRTFKKVAAGHELRLHHHRGPQIGTVSYNLAKKSRWSDSDDGEWIIAQPYLPADNGRVAGESSLPVSVADDYKGVAPRNPVFAGRERASQQRFDAKCLEVIPGYESAAGCFGAAPFHGDP